MLCDYDREYDTARFEYSRGSGSERISYITDSDGDLNVFHVGHDGGELWLYGYDGRPGYFWGSVCRFVFVRRK